MTKFRTLKILAAILILLSTSLVAIAEDVELKEELYALQFDEDGYFYPKGIFDLACRVVEGKTQWDPTNYLTDEVVALLERYKTKGLDDIFDDDDPDLASKVFKFLYETMSQVSKIIVSDDVTIYTSGNVIRSKDEVTFKNLFEKSYIDFNLIDWLKKNRSVREGYLDVLANIFGDEADIYLYEIEGVKIVGVRRPVLRYDSKELALGEISWENSDRTFSIIEDKDPKETSMFSVKWGTIALEATMYRAKKTYEKYDGLPYIYFFIRLDRLQELSTNDINIESIKSFMLDKIDRVELILPKASYIWPKSLSN